jgi:hypothetical protein
MTTFPLEHLTLAEMVAYWEARVAAATSQRNRDFARAMLRRTRHHLARTLGA